MTTVSKTLGGAFKSGDVNLAVLSKLGDREDGRRQRRRQKETRKTCGGQREEGEGVRLETSFLSLSILPLFPSPLTRISAEPEAGCLTRTEYLPSV